MRFHIDTAAIYVPDGSPMDEAVARTTHMAIGAHQDDLEIMAYQGIVECFGKDDKHFMGVIVTNGSGSPRDDLYAHYTDDEMQKVRRLEQKKAAFVGEYCAQALLDFPSSAVKDGTRTDVIDDIKALLVAAKPKIVYTHNLADKHDTHVGVALRLIRALRELPKEARPQKLFGCEVWRNLDWLNDDDKVVFDVSAHENLAMSLVGIFDSQIAGGKRYDIATMGRRRANATYFASHATDVATSVIFAVDLAPLMENEALDPRDYVAAFIDRFARDVAGRIAKLS